MTSGKKQILWVDDEIEFLRAHIMFLEEHNYEVAKANNGDDAIVMIKNTPFDLVFLDEQMPGKDGLTTLEEMKAIRPNIPVVMVTKSEEEQLMEEAFGRNIDGYLTKPVNPSQILSVCKSILHARVIKKTHVTAAYINKYAEFKTRLMNSQSPQDWCAFYMNLCKWDLNLPALKDQGIEETHQNHKKEAAGKFSSFVEHHYLKWHSGRSANPYLITSSLNRTLFPIIKNQQKACLIILAGFRMDQWLVIKELLEPFFKVSESHAWTLLPSERLYCRSALLSGKPPLTLSLDQPELWKKLSHEEEHRQFENELLKMNLFSNGINSIENPPMAYIRHADDSQHFLNKIDSLNDEALVVMCVEFAQLFLELRQENRLLMELAPDELGLRELTRLWFQSSNLLKILSTFAQKGRHVVLTSDHGSVLVKEYVEVFCQEEKTPHPRVKTGKGISCDERRAFFIEAPAACGLPGGDDSAYAIAKEDYYFIYPNKYHYFGTRFKGQMVSGGLSMEEMLVPLITMAPAEPS